MRERCSIQQGEKKTVDQSKVLKNWLFRFFWPPGIKFNMSWHHSLLGGGSELVDCSSVCSAVGVTEVEVSAVWLGVWSATVARQYEQNEREKKKWYQIDVLIFVNYMKHTPLVPCRGGSRIFIWGGGGGGGAKYYYGRIPGRLETYLYINVIYYLKGPWKLSVFFLWWSLVLSEPYFKHSHTKWDKNTHSRSFFFGGGGGGGAPVAPPLNPPLIFVNYIKHPPLVPRQKGC